MGKVLHVCGCVIVGYYVDVSYVMYVKLGAQQTAERDVPC